ncbi:DUF6883 domain-containing protein [Anoxybacteroides amylolyticum]|uniref:Adhesin HecA family domain protein n=1 Tax=Anoxybacteroides amylolyticum TaxID=294699 RepID=A0A167TQ82_9BACL|nr:DUF6883 domain-containing protein [Anoxybacillus amylolyticus]ANB61824.1 adhesin HecA family domain protein [Anoxybacillus amylolyticus]
MVKHVAHDVKQVEKAIQNVEKKVEHAAKQAVRDTVHISEKAQKAFHEAEKKTEQAVKRVVHDGQKAASEAVHSIVHKIKQEIKETGKAIERDTRQLEKKAEHVTKQAVHDIINAGQKIEQAARQVAKNAEKSWHGLTKHPMESTVEFVRGAGDAIVQDITLDNIHRSYHSPHPVAYESGKMAGHAVSTIAGMIETSGSEALEVGGASLTATGEGAFVGVPVMVMAGEGMAYGQAETSLSFNRLVKSAEELYQRMSRSEGGSGKVVKRADETEKFAKGTGKVQNSLPNLENAKIDPRKLTDYALNPDHPVGGNKARVFQSALGYNKSNADNLMKQIQQKLPQSEAVLGKADQYGQRYTVDMQITGPNGNTTTVRTGWILKPGSDAPEMTTIYVK